MSNVSEIREEAKRLNKIQMDILIKNHGSLSAVKSHLNGISQLVDTIYEKAKKTKMKAYTITGSDGKELEIDPVSIVFHRMMNKAKRQQGFIS